MHKTTIVKSTEIVVNYSFLELALSQISHYLPTCSDSNALNTTNYWGNICKSIEPRRKIRIQEVAEQSFLPKFSSIYRLKKKNEKEPT